MPKTLTPIHAIQAGNMSGNLTTAVIPIQFEDNMAIQCIWSGTPTGTIAIQGSVDNVNFVTVPPSPAISQPAGSAGVLLANYAQLAFSYLKVTYTAGSGSGTLDVWLSGKSESGA